VPRHLRAQAAAGRGVPTGAVVLHLRFRRASGGMACFMVAAISIANLAPRRRCADRGRVAECNDVRVLDGSAIDIAQTI